MDGHAVFGRQGGAEIGRDPSASNFSAVVDDVHAHGPTGNSQVSITQNNDNSETGANNQHGVNTTTNNRNENAGVFGSESNSIQQVENPLSQQEDVEEDFMEPTPRRRRRKVARGGKKATRGRHWRKRAKKATRGGNRRARTVGGRSSRGKRILTTRARTGNRARAPLKLRRGAMAPTRASRRVQTRTTRSTRSKYTRR